MSQRDLFFKYMGQTSPAPLAIEIVRAKGCKLYTAQGQIILDFISGISVSNTGHGHPDIVNAVTNQALQYMHLMVYGELIQSPQVLLAEKLSKVLPPELSSYYFVASGSEAVEGSLKLAKRFTSRNRLVSFSNAYHGSSQGALSVCGNEMLKNAFRPLLPGITILDFNDESSLDAIDNQTAAVIVEPIQGEAGVVLPTANFHQRLRQRCNDTGTLLIYDEIQTGFGRTGKLFAFEHFHVRPDILVLGKALGGGMPLGAFVSSPDIMRSLTHDPVLGHITTFGGHPVCCAAALASLNIILENKLADAAEKLGRRIREKIHHPLIRDVRGKGLFLSVEFENEEMNRKIIDDCIKNGLFVDWFLFAPHCMRLAPPLTITEAEIDEACGIILGALERASDAAFTQ
jgi:acetylornithine/N-succinyldiaminopimelate aminotransferase